MDTELDYSWVDGLDERGFIQQVIERRLTLADIMLILPYYPIGRSALFFQFLVETLKPSATDIYIYIRQVDIKQFIEPFFAYTKKTGFPSSMLAWLLKEKNLLGHDGFFDLFLSSNPSPSDFCWVFGEFPVLKTRRYITEFVRSKPNQYHINYMVDKLGVGLDWLLDDNELDKVYGFIYSLEAN